MATALWIGDAELPEFAPAAAVLRRRLRLVVVPRGDAALRCEPAAEWTVAVVAEALPGEHASEAIDELRRRRPTLPIVRLVGPGCDGEMRSRPPAAGHRYRWLEAPGAFEDDCDLLERRECPGWGLPVTQGPEERLLAAVVVAEPMLTAVRIDVQSHDAALSAWLVDLVRDAGAQVARGEADVVLRHVTDDRRTHDVDDRRGTESVSEAAVVALVSFPRAEQADRLRAEGVFQVVALPAAPGTIERAVAAAAASNRLT